METKVAIALAAAVVLGVAGFLSAGVVTASSQAPTLTTQRVVTVVRKPRLRASAQVETAAEIVTQAVTVRRDGRTVVVRSPGKTITVHRRSRQRVLPAPGTNTVVRTVTAPGHATTVTRAGETVTAPGPTVTTTAPPSTVTHTVTAPASTVTETITQEETVLNTVTETETVTVTVTVGKK